MLNLARPFLEALFTQITSFQIDIGNREIDHICYSTSTFENYEKGKKYFLDYGRILEECDIAGRPIATFKLFSPLYYRHHVIDLIELTAPKKGKTNIDGPEHIEVVIDESFDSFARRHSHLHFNFKITNQSLNPEISIKLNSGRIKFHHKSLEQVIHLEKHPLVTDFLAESHIFQTLSPFTPLLAGEIPLGIDAKNARATILLEAQDFDLFVKNCMQHFGPYQNFSINQSEQKKNERVTINFSYKDLPVTLRCEKISVFKQLPNQHLLIGGRLLKLLGRHFKNKILNLIKNGDDLEEVFLHALGLSDHLEILNELSDTELINQYSRGPY